MGMVLACSCRQAWVGSSERCGRCRRYEYWRTQLQQQQQELQLALTHSLCVSRIWTGALLEDVDELVSMDKLAVKGVLATATSSAATPASSPAPAPTPPQAAASGVAVAPGSYSAAANSSSSTTTNGNSMPAKPQRAASTVTPVAPRLYKSNPDCFTKAIRTLYNRYCTAARAFRLASVVFITGLQ